MLAEWSAEAGPLDPVLVVPWSDPADPSCSFVDLRRDPYALHHIAEAEQHPPLLQALRALNAARSPVFTAKCDAWTMEAEEREAVRLNLDLSAPESAAGFASYVDCLWRERALFVSVHQQEQRLTRLARLLDALDHPASMVECVLRPAVLDLSPGAFAAAHEADQEADHEADKAARAQEGFAFTTYVRALGTDAPHAYQEWSRALAAVVAVLRGREFSAT